MRSILLLALLSLASALNYTLVEVWNNQTKFTETVNNHLKSGWKLAGSHSTTSYGYNNRNMIYTQAMIKD